MYVDVGSTYGGDLVIRRNIIGKYSSYTYFVHTRSPSTMFLRHSSAKAQQVQPGSVHYVHHYNILTYFIFKATHLDYQ